MFDNLPEAAHKEIDALIKRYRADLPLQEYIATLQPKHFPQLLPKIQSYGFGWTQVQVEADATKHLINTSSLLSCGFARRILHDSPADLARSASLDARLQLWQGTRDEYNGFLYHAPNRLKALAGGDFYVVQRFVETVPPRVTSGKEPWRFMHGGMAGAIRRDDELLATAIVDFDTWKKPMKYISAIYMALRGLLAKDATMVAAGLDELLKASRHIKQLDELYKVISLETHSMYELCRWYDPALVAEFDTGRKLPWDKGLYDWVRQNEGNPPFYDLTSLSPEMQQWVTELPFRDDRKHYWTTDED